MTPERIKFVLNYQWILAETLVGHYCGHRGIGLIEAFASGAESRAREISRTLSARLLDDEDKLTEHGDSLRSISRYIKDLTNRIVPAILRDPSNQRLRIEATAKVAYVESHFKAMEMGIA